MTQSFLGHYLSRTMVFTLRKINTQEAFDWEEWKVEEGATPEARMEQNAQLISLDEMPVAWPGDITGGR